MPRSGCPCHGMSETVCLYLHAVRGALLSRVSRSSMKLSLTTRDETPRSIVTDTSLWPSAASLGTHLCGGCGGCLVSLRHSCRRSRVALCPGNFAGRSHGGGRGGLVTHLLPHLQCSMRPPASTRHDQAPTTTEHRLRTTRQLPQSVGCAEDGFRRCNPCLMRTCCEGHGMQDACEQGDCSEGGALEQRCSSGQILLRLGLLLRFLILPLRGCMPVSCAPQ